MMASNLTFKQKHNIAYFIDGLGMGGAERMMAPMLRNLNKEIFLPRVCVFNVRNGNPIADELLSLSIPVDLLPIPYLRDISAIPRLRSYLKQHKIDLVHTQLEMGDILGNIAAKSLHLPSVSTLHTMPALGTKMKSRVHQGLEWIVLRFFCNRVIAVSEETRLYHQKYGKLQPQRTITIHNGIDLRLFNVSDIARASLRSELRIPMDAHVLTTVAVLREPKGIQYMIQALPQVLVADPKVWYLVAGDGLYRDALLEEADKAGVSDRVVFAGQRKDISNILAASDVFVLPTLTEALPTVLAEAMACKLPIVASSVGGIPEMVTEGWNGKLLAPGDVAGLAQSVIALLSDKAQRKVMGEHGLSVVNEKFSVQLQLERLEKLYLQLLGEYGK